MKSAVGLALMLAIGVAIGETSRGDDWPQWLGPKRDAVWNETGLIEKFPEGGVSAKWRVPAALGYSGPAVSGGRVYLTDYVTAGGDTTNDPGTRRVLKGKERIRCLDAKTGDKVWEHSYDREYNISYPSGPRATPTVHDGLVYMLGAEGDLVCLDAAKGGVVWSKFFPADYGAKAPIWGFAAAPLVDGDLVFSLVGGDGSVVVAFDRKTGKEVWKALSATEPGYAAPSMIEAAGIKQLIIWHAESINSLNPQTGKVYWTIPLKPDYGMSIMIPQRHGDFLFASGIGNVGALLKLDNAKPGAEVVWRGKNDNALYAANATPLIDADGVMYGADCRGGQLRGVDLMSGKRLWETFAPTTGTRRGTHGTVFLVKNNDRYVLFSETGDLIFAKLTSKGYDEISRMHVLDPTGECFGREVVWSHPAYANKCAFCRNDKELVCISLADKQP